MTTTTPEIPMEDVSEKRIVRAACAHDCPDTCAILVTVEGDTVTGVRGDPEHPFTRGGLCAKVNDYEKRAYHPDRLLYPLRRTGPKGSGEFERISWDEAVAEICSRFTSIAAEFGGEAIMPTSYLGNQGILNGLTVMDPFMHRLGASITERTFCTSTRGSAYLRTVGPAVTDPEGIVHARYIVVWGHNMLTSHLHLWPFVTQARKAGAKLVVIDPYRSRTAKQADWHIRIRPGTDGALALGMMNVIIAEGLQDQDYIDAHTTGFAELAAKAAEFPPERVEAITGIPADDVRTLAREYATTQPAALRVGTAVENHPQGGQAFRAIFSLPALVGAWRYPGGGTHELTLFSFPVNFDRLSRTDLIRPGTRTINALQLGRALTGELELDPPVMGLMVCNANPVITVPEQNKTIAGLCRDDLFTVVSDHFLTDTARYADIVLPATTILEHFDVMFSWGHLYVSVNNPAIEPLGEAVSNVEMFRRLAAGMGFDDDPWFRMTDEELARECLDWEAPVMDGITLEGLCKTGWARLALPGPDEAPFADGGFGTPSTKVEFALTGDTDSVVPVFRQGYTELQGDTASPPVPDHVPEVPDPRHPLKMITPRGHAFLSSQYANMDRQLSSEQGQHVTLHPEEAQRRGLVAGAVAEVFNDLGAFRAVVRVDDGVLPGVAVAPYGFWRNGDSTVAALVSGDLNDLGRGPRYSAASVDVRPA
ncbi:molybdopterin-dependent oxidoreductase [Pseudonocardia sp. NPDC049635]|uniref:molybdopterin-containing oxidoreductase family protein n=1 Tax=Pseudonocardia sp. NPDC049635 TaxID=3155506 RepID=UPI0033F2F6A9